MNIVGDHADDILHTAFRRLLGAKKIEATRGKCREVLAARIELRNPRCRISQTESRGKIFSAIGELLWYLSGSDYLDFIKYYIKLYEDESDDGRTIKGAYGPRIFSPNSPSQWEVVRRILLTKQTSRRAVIQLIKHDDVSTIRKEIPCTVALQFFLREKQLHMQTYMRSNDAIKGLPHDIFAFTMLQEIMARDLDVSLGRYYHCVGSLHLYEDDAEDARNYLEQGHQEASPMPSMPHGSQWTEIKQVLQAEQRIRLDDYSAPVEMPKSPYWLDIVTLLKIFKARKNHDNDAVYRLKQTISNVGYLPFVRSRGVEKPAAEHSGRQLSLLDEANGGKTR